MNKFEQRIRNLVPEIPAEVNIHTGNMTDALLGFRALCKEHKLPTPSPEYILVLMSGVYLAAMPDGTIVLSLSQDVGQYLTDNQIRAMALHELAHFVNEDYKKGTTPGELYNVEQAEVRADRFALDHGVDPQDMLDGILLVTEHGMRQCFAVRQIMRGEKISQDEIETAVSDFRANAWNSSPQRFRALYEAIATS